MNIAGLKILNEEVGDDFGIVALIYNQVVHTVLLWLPVSLIPFIIYLP